MTVSVDLFLYYRYLHAWAYIFERRKFPTPVMIPFSKTTTNNCNALLFRYYNCFMVQYGLEPSLKNTMEMMQSLQKDRVSHSGLGKGSIALTTRTIQKWIRLCKLPTQLPSTETIQAPFSSQRLFRGRPRHLQSCLQHPA